MTGKEHAFLIKKATTNSKFYSAFVDFIYKVYVY